MALTHKKTHIFIAWSGWIFTFGFLVSVSPWLGGLIPPLLSPMHSALDVKKYYIENQLGIQIGAWLGMCASAFYYSWGASLAAVLRRTENGRPPVLTYTCLGAIGVAVFNSVLTFFWMGFCAYRADTIDPVLLRHLNDFLYFQLEFEVFPLSLWAVAMGLMIILDKSAKPVYPRWVAWVNFWYAGLVMSGQFMVFFHQGPMAYNGVLAVWWPAFVFFVWICVMSWATILTLKKDDGVRFDASQEEFL